MNEVLPTAQAAAPSTLRLRLVVGTLLGVGAIVVYCLDAYLASMPDSPRWPIPLLNLDLGPWLYKGALSTAVALVFTCLAAQELVDIARAGGHRPFGLVALVFAAGAVVGPYVSFHLRGAFAPSDGGWGMMWLALAVALAYLVQAVRRRTKNALENLAITVFIIFYTGGLIGFLTKLCMEVGADASGMRAATGVILVLFTILIVKSADIGAFFVGRSFGRNKLIEWLSPKKTWEGFFGGLATAVVVSLVAGSYLHFAGIAPLRHGPLAYPWGLLIYGVLMGLLSVAGDLCASLLKRDAAVKDSGRIIPGMGGVLDVLDSIMLAAPGAWFFWARCAGLA